MADEKRKEYNKEYLKKYNEQNKEKRRAYYKEYYKKNKEQMINSAKRSYENNKDTEEYKEKRREIAKKEYYKDVEKTRAKNREYSMAKTFYIYYAWLAIDDDICLPKLCTIVEENWEAILNSEFGLDEIKTVLYD